ncbi:MAG: N-acetyltransferase [Deferribacterota bacterium]|nr:N-acetyltransferase [Deferribacterota bacterium]
MEDILIKPVENKRDLMTFIKLPFAIYRDDPYWVPPLILERKEHFSVKNPFFEHAKVQFFLAFHKNRCVGRIGAHIDYLYIEQHKEKCGFFSFLEAIDDIDVFRRLLMTAEEWVKNEGMEHIMGPFNFSTNDEVGLLVKGFDSSPSFMMGHAKPYYAEYLEMLGYSKEKDLNCYILDLTEKLSPFMIRLIEKTKEKIEVKPVNKKELKGASKMLMDMFNDSWTNNWGFIPFTENEFYYIAKQLKNVIEDDFALVAYYNGFPSGMLINFPNLNEIIKDLNGHLFPLGFLKILYRLKLRKYELLRGALLGVRRRYHKNILATALISHLLKSTQEVFKKKGFRYLDASWVLEDNKGINDLISLGHSELFKVYRVYGKKLD